MLICKMNIYFFAYKNVCVFVHKNIFIQLFTMYQCSTVTVILLTSQQKIIFLCLCRMLSIFYVYVYEHS